MRPNPRKADSVRDLGPVDLSGIREAVLEIPEAVWDLENNCKPNDFGALSTTRHVVFRFIADPASWAESYDRALWASWKERLLPLMAQVVRPYGYARGAYPRVMLARMAPGGIIRPHVDRNRAARWPHKIHVPITTNDNVTFFVDRQGYKLQVGRAYEINNMAEHAVANQGDSDRIHLIFEYYDLDQPEA
jgi:hypothetical protein